MKAYRPAVVMAVVLWAAIAHYHFLRRGVANPFGPHELNALFLANKGFALTSLTMMSLSVLLGPLAKWRKSCARWVGYRKQIGLVGAALLGLHIPVSLLLLPDDFPLRWYADHLPTLALGILSLAVLIVIVVHSTETAKRRLGFRRWKSIQRLVYPMIGLAVAHYLLMGKPANWVRWSHTLETPLPPGTLVMTTIVAIVMTARLISLISDNRK